VKKLIVLGAGPAIAAVAASAALFGAGTAVAAPDVVGDTYSDAQSTIEESGGTATVASRVGDKLDEGDCIVTNAWDASFLRIDSAADGQVMVALNCNGAFATATNPGTSVQNPLGRAAKTQAEEEAAEQEEQELAEAATPDE
jgi:ornithine carbamoyltransferase